MRLIRALCLLLVCCYEPSPQYTLHFPARESLGDLRIRDDVNCFTCGTGSEHLGPAIGTKEVRLPASRWYVSLKMPRDVTRLVPYLSDPSLEDLGDIDLSRSNVTDDDLRYLDHINLRSIDLSGTNITGAGLKYLHPHKKWIFVTIQDCERLNPEYLAHFRGWTRSTIRAVDYKSSGQTTRREEELLRAARRIICDDQPESVCGAQIR